MDSQLQTLTSIASVTFFLAAIPALWISGRIVLRNWRSEARPVQLFLWLALGGFFLIPLVDLISYLRDLIALALPPDPNAGRLSLFFVSMTWQSYSGVVIAMGITVYTIALYFGRRLLSSQKPLLLKGLIAGPLERSFLVLGTAGLFNQMVKGLILNFVWMEFPVPAYLSPYGSAGSLTGWIISFLVFAVIILFMNDQLRTRADKK